MGFARRFRPTYAGGERGAPVQRTRLALDGQSLSPPPKITPLKLRSINEYLCDALH